ncbi:uncharacterized protein LOC108744923 isoform X2 [Agrilus planipennis]|uniref:Uncharacterized protein LOC108744923 isoform X2 n=1 Tax=Agrilus planipennis TaxID=224129 RepID=A0A1W4XV99_AGRPL|nr:uncharacterized protein LOC108744923 isoform X2 [Agrilus planipennis]
MNKNDNILKECSICLKSDSCLLRAVDVDSNNLSYSIKLSFCVPEVEWNDDSICNNCALLLDQAYEFKELCLKSKEVISYQVTTEQSLENEKIGVRNEGEALQHSEDDYSVNSDQDRDQEVDHKYPYRHSSKGTPKYLLLALRAANIYRLQRTSKTVFKSSCTCSK